MGDRYRNYQELSGREREGVDYRVETVIHGERFFALAAIHGGGIERGTSELAEAVAGKEWNLYRFEGMKPPGENRNLHLTSTRFDEPRLADVLCLSRRVVGIHGARGEDPVCFIGGRDLESAEAIASQLRAWGMAVRWAPSSMAGTHRRNICNRGQDEIGVQLELTTSLRRSFFHDFSHRGRRETATPAFYRFAGGLRRALAKVAAAIPDR
ncbi:poly-gamma-glutamate hydrolase family protein [Desmospora profundinema]|uniref:Phage replication-related protein YjqB (UPF0714/DUF867 family) n=1 Tax=Desmospora profundinema TaxID=1571184 RepID=A0ABU1IPI9_9BACL|nr:poly-gamma-glutamate hydrolase family protein [Desmospora profundinema]MDR6226707.1 phage replication-related protein YjqB (UPF0714/DUF867 family) [Desmospora profundinema]